MIAIKNIRSIATLAADAPVARPARWVPFAAVGGFILLGIFAAIIRIGMEKP